MAQIEGANRIVRDYWSNAIFDYENFIYKLKLLCNLFDGVTEFQLIAV